MTLDQHLDRRSDGGEGRGAGGIGDKVGAAQVQHVGDPARDDVGQFPRHRIFARLGQRALHLGVKLLKDRRLHPGG